MAVRTEVLQRFGFCCMVLLATLTARVNAAEDAPLFSLDRFEASTRQGPPSPQGEPVPHFLPEDPNERRPPSRTARQRAATMDSGLLEALRLEVQQQRTGTVRLNLFADTSLNAVFERTAPTASGYTLTGRIEGQPASTVVLAVNGEFMSGMVWTAEGIYTIEAIGDATAIRQASSAAFGQCLTAERAPRDLIRRQLPPSPAPSSATPADDGSVIDVLVVYPSLVRRTKGGHRAMRAVIDRDVAFTNAAYRDSGALQRINLVAAVELAYAEAEEDTDMYRLLDHLVDPTSGYMDEAHALRESYAADMVLQHRGDLLGSGPGLVIGGIAGIAYQMTQLSAEDEAPYAFSISNSFAFAHELGHGMGLRHERALDLGNTPFPYSHGYVVHDESESLDGLHTIMGNGRTSKRIPRFSNPQDKYPDANGALIGVPGDAPSDSPAGPADSVRSLNETRQVVANFRRGANRCAYSLSLPPSDLPATGGEYRVQVRTQPDCAWTAHSNDAFVTVTAGVSGTGNGEVAYSVSANNSWEREVAVMVAGEVYLAIQAGERTFGPVAVCQRPWDVYDALEDTLGKPCADITANDLALVRELRINHVGRVEPSWSGAFLGLVNLATLRISSYGLVTLQPGMFDGLPNLYELSLERNSNLQTIQSGAFNGLTNLRELKISESPVTSLQPGAFRGLYNLRELSLGRTRLVSLSEGAFDGLSKLTDLFFFSESLTRVAPRAFRGLPSLEYLVFNDTSIETLPPNIFEGLDSLEGLVLRYHDRLTTLPPGVFNGLPKLWYLDILENALTLLPSGLFDALPSLRRLFVADHDELTLEPGTFNGLSNLEWLLLPDNGLTTLDAGALDGLSDLEVLNLNRNSISDVSALSALTNLKVLHVAVNSISDFSPLVANVGLGRDDWVRLDGNPWSMESLLTHIPALRRRGVEVLTNHAITIGDASAAEGESLVFHVSLHPAWSSDLAVDWEAMDRTGNASPGSDYPANQSGTVTVPAGATHERFLVRTSQDNVAEGAEHFAVLLEPPAGGLPDGVVIDTIFGTATILDDDPPLNPNEAPQAISVLPDVYTVIGTRTSVPAAANFTDPEGDALAISAVSFNPAVVAVRLDEPGVITVEALRPGLAAVVVTATDPHGETAAVTFSVRVSTSRQAVVGANDELALAQDDTVRLDLLASFRELDEHALVFVAESSDPTVATVDVGRNSVTVEAGSEGSATIVVTATDPTGETTALTFTVTVVDAPRRRGLPLWLLSKG